MPSNISNSGLASRNVRYAILAVVIGEITTIFITPFLSSWLASIAQIFGREFWGYDSPNNVVWFSLVSAITSSFFVLIISGELSSRKKDLDKQEIVLVLLKSAGFFLLMWLTILLGNPIISFVLSNVCKLIC